MRNFGGSGVALSDVMANSQHAQHFIPGIFQRCLGGFQQLPMAITGKADPFFIHIGAAFGDGCLIIDAKSLCQRVIDKVVIGLANYFAFLGAKKLLKTRVAQQVDPCRIF